MLRSRRNATRPTGFTTLDSKYLGPHNEVAVRYTQSYVLEDGFTYRLGVPEAASTDVYCDGWRTTDRKKHRMVRFEDIPQETLKTFMTSVYQNLI